MELERSDIYGGEDLYSIASKIAEIERKDRDFENNEKWKALREMQDKMFLAKAYYEKGKLENQLKTARPQLKKQIKQQLLQLDKYIAINEKQGKELN